MTITLGIFLGLTIAVLLMGVWSDDLPIWRGAIIEVIAGVTGMLLAFALTNNL